MPSLLEQFPRRRNGTEAHVRRIDAAGSITLDLRQRLQTQFFGLFGAHDNHCRGAVIDARGVSGRNGAVLLEDGREFRHFFEGRIHGTLVHGKDLGIALPLRNDDGYDLVSHGAAGDSRPCPSMALIGYLILLGPGRFRTLRQWLPPCYPCGNR